jgi:NADH-quinone oxidoreductase subunit C
VEPSQVAEKIREKFPEEVIQTEESRGQVSVTLKKGRVIEIFTHLHDEPSLFFDLLKDLCGTDYLGKRDVRFEVVYHFYSMKHKHFLRVKVPVSEIDCSIDSVISIWRGADWHERECFDMYGIEFKGHPDLRRILLPEDWKGYPLRKDYPARGPEQEWPGFTEVLEKAREFEKYEWNR